MKKQLLIYFLFIAIGFLIGFIVFRGKPVPEKIIHPPENVTVGPAPPDTVLIENIKIIKEPIVIQAKAKTDTVMIEHKTAVLSADEEIEVSAPIYVSFKEFAFDEKMVPLDKPFKNYLVKSDIWAWSSSPVDSFQNEITVKWNDYYEKTILPVHEFQLARIKNISIMKGILAGGLAAYGISSEKWYIAVPALAAGVGIVFYF